MLRLLTIFMLVAITGGCRSNRAPTVDVLGAQFGATSEEAMVIDLTLELVNLNNESLRLLDVEYNVAVNGTRVFTGTRSAETTLAGNDQRHMRLPAVLHVNSVASPSTYSISGKIKYIKPGELARVFRDMGFPNPSVSFSGGGNIERKLAQSE